MTHELKTPIATISLAVDAMNNPLIRNDELKFKNYCRILKEENQKLNQHVERVLQTSLLEKGKLHLNKRTTDLISVIRSSIQAFSLQAESQEAEIVFEPLDKEIKIVADEEHLRAVFSNLIDNALKYSEYRCRISITVLKKENSMVVMIKDNGIGIEAKHKEKIFEKFYRVQGGNLHDVKGFGLGLSYVKSIIEAHGGHITMVSGTGKGSEFIITLNGEV
jgi:two-component system, OmpR family, phosphate regulon sensor histidine kinase PhoR